MSTTQRNSTSRSTEQLVQPYLDQGYFVVENLLDADEIELLRREIFKIARGEYAISNPRPLPAGATDEEALARVSVIYSPHGVSRVLLDFARHPKVCEVAGQVAAAHRYGWDGSAKFVQSTANVKPPGAKGHPWHQDHRSIRTWDQSLCAVWVPLDDATVDNGCLWVVPGSHLHGYLYPMRPHNQPAEFMFINESCGFDETAAVPLEMPAGSALFCSGTLLHRSLGNRTESFRCAIVNHYTNAWTELPWFDQQNCKLQDDLRTVIPVAGEDPYAWKGYEPPDDRVYVAWLEDEQEGTPP